MNILERLKQLKNILPDQDYTLRSRSFILSSLQNAQMPRLTVWQFIMQNIQMGSAIALTGLLLLLGFGGFSAWKFLSPFGLRSLDPAGLRAEADAVQDIQVALKSIQYIQPADPSPAPAKPGIAGAVSPKPLPTSPDKNPTILENPPENVTTTEATASSTSDNFSTTTVDDALDFLLEQ